jgi:hypothetical protein
MEGSRGRRGKDVCGDIALLGHCENGRGGVIGGAYRRCPGLAELLKPIPKNMKIGLIVLDPTYHIMLILMLKVCV